MSEAAEDLYWKEEEASLEPEDDDFEPLFEDQVEARTRFESDCQNTAFPEESEDD